MQKLTKNGTIENMPWSLCDEDATSLKGLKKPSLVSLSTLQQLADEVSDFTNIALVLSTDSNLDELPCPINRFSAVAIHFPAFADGRGFSLARKIRDQLGFSGELMAFGHFMQDQLFYLRRCGFDSFILPDNDITDEQLSSMQASLQDFSESYQAAIDVASPLFRRRSA